MSHFWITVPLAATWLGLGIVFIALCRAAGRADEQQDDAALRAARPRTMKQHIFAVHARTLRSMRRPSAQRRQTRGAHAHGLGGGDSAFPFHSA